MHLLEFQLRVVLETSSENYPIRSEEFLAGDGSYQESCNRLYLLLSAFEGSVCFNLSYYISLYGGHFFVSTSRKCSLDA